MRATTLPLCALLALLAGAPAAHAAGVDPAGATAVQREQAQSKYVRGKKKFDDGDFKGALDEFRESLEIVASPNTRLYVARTLAKMGRLVEAYAEFGRTAVEAKEHEHEDGRYAKAAEAAAAERAALSPQLGFLEISIVNPTEQTKLTVGGDEIKRAAWGEAVPVLPGEVTVEAISPGGLPARSHLSIAGGAHVPITLDVGMAAPVASTQPAPSPPAPAPASSMSWTLPAGLAAGGVAVGGLVTFAIGGVMSSSTYSDLQKACGTAPCPASKQSEVSAGKTQQTIANVGLVVGVVGAVASGALLFVYFTHHKADAPRAQSGIFLGPGELGLRGSF